MIVSIGMLAYNEATGIAQTIASLLAQSVFHGGAAAAAVTEWELVVVPNGCTDDTAVVAEAALRSGLKSITAATVTHSVRVLAEGGKSNAWNHYIHELSRPDADSIVMIDTDIEFGHPDTILNCLAELRRNTVAKVVVDLPLKDFVKKAKLSWIERISMKSSGTVSNDDVAISGQFYCAFANTLRQIWMPVGLSGEDGFLRSMIVTDLFRSEPDVRRVARAADASHYFEGLSRPADIFHHELRMVIGTCLNCYFTWDFLKFATDPAGPGAGALIRHQLAADPTWYRRVIEHQIRTRGRFVIPRDMVFRRFAALRGSGWRRTLRRLPMALVGTMIDVPTFWIANRKLRSGRALGFW
ncbi:MAG: glycosyltransferase family A protein [Burkholderiaceae bacterium]